MKSSNHMNKRFSIFTLVTYSLFFVLMMVCILPFLHLIAKSFSGNNAVIAGLVAFVPIDFQVGVYAYVMQNKLFWQAFQNSLFITGVGTLASMFVTVLAAYPLSKPSFKGRKLVLLMYVFSMLFYGGTIPIYILMRTLGLLNTLWAMIIPFLVIPFNLFIIKTYFEGIPEGIEESAKIDGATQTTILTKIVLPLSSPTLATIGLFYIVNYWNAYYHAMLFVNKQQAKPLQLYLYEMINSAAATSTELGVEAAMNLSTGGMQAASIVLGMLPVVIMYPFVQKYFVHGLTIGSVKG